MLDGNMADTDAIKKMLPLLQSYGPDHQRVLSANNAAFAHALLATTPEALVETQPWTDSTSGCVVVCDSRLDNRSELVAALALKHKPEESIGDAELIFAAYQDWGNACVEKLLGDFAFVIWNPVSQQLFCARDPLGIRPLYYHFVANKLFAFATTSSALSQLLQTPVACNEGRLADAMTEALEGYDHSSTFFRDIQRLPPATALQLEKAQSPTLRRYWQPLQHPPSPWPNNEQEWLAQLKTHFTEAVHCRLRSHLPISSMLSGGLDSSAVVAIASKKLEQEGRPPLSVFSGVSNQDHCAETQAIRLMQTNFNTQHYEIDPEKSPELLNAMAEKWPLLEEPFEAFITLVHAQYLSAAQQDKRIVLDGIDADSLFAEGDYWHALVRAGRWRTIWKEARASVKFWGSEATLSYFLRPLLSAFFVPNFLRQMVRRLRQTFRPARQNQQAIIEPGFAQAIDLENRYQTLATNTQGMKAQSPSGHPAYSAMASSNAVVGMERYHRVAGLYGIEARHPFMDRRLVEFCAWLPMELRLRNGYPKWALRAALENALPTAITWRRGKEHLGWPFNQQLWRQAGNTLCHLPLHPWLHDKVQKPLLEQYEHCRQSHVLGDPLESEIEPLLKLGALNRWLQKNIEP